MKTLSKTLLGATAAAALAVASASPAQARGNDRIDAGDVITGALVLGGIAAVVAAATSDDDRYDRRYEDRHDDRRGYRGAYLTPRQAVSQCSTAAQRDASRYGRARVTEITDVDEKRNGYDVSGRIVVDEGRYRRGHRDRYDRRGYNDYDRGRFECRIRNGRINRLRVRGLD